MTPTNLIDTLRMTADAIETAADEDASEGVRRVGLATANRGLAMLGVRRGVESGAYDVLQELEQEILGVIRV